MSGAAPPTTGGGAGRPATAATDPAMVAARPPMPGLHLPEWGAEFLGTMLLVLGGLSAVCLDFGPGSPVADRIPSVSARLLLTGALFAGSGSLVAVSPLGRISGAHLNPAVTLAFWATGHVHRNDLAGYVAAQCAGAVTGTLLLAAVWRDTARALAYGRTAPAPGVGDLAATGLETLMTLALVLTIFALVSSPRSARFTPLGTWVVVTLAVWRGAPDTGTSINPARSLGPDLVAWWFGSYWVYVAGPLLGGLLAAVAVRGLAQHRRLLTAKLFHDPRYRTVFRTRLAARRSE